MEKEKVYFSDFTTKKGLIYRMYKRNECNEPSIRVIYAQNPKDTNHYDFFFVNREICTEIYNDLINIINACKNDDFINFGEIINGRKKEFNNLVFGEEVEK